MQHVGRQQPPTRTHQVDTSILALRTIDGNSTPCCLRNAYVCQTHASDGSKRNAPPHCWIIPSVLSRTIPPMALYKTCVCGRKTRRKIWVSGWPSHSRAEPPRRTVGLKGVSNVPRPRQHTEYSSLYCTPLRTRTPHGVCTLPCTSLAMLSMNERSESTR